MWQRFGHEIVTDPSAPEPRAISTANAIAASPQLPHGGWDWALLLPRMASDGGRQSSEKIAVAQ
jgi:hypothetical protein